MKITSCNKKLKIVISKSEWVKIAQESITINGKTYTKGEMYVDDQGNDYLLEDFSLSVEGDIGVFKALYNDGSEKNIVMTLPQKKSLTFGNFVFKVGQIYSNRKGQYEVIDIDIPNRSLRVRYIGGAIDGEEQTLNALEQYKVIRNMEVERDRGLGIDRIDFGNDGGNYFTIGFLAANGKITVQTTDTKENETLKIYKGLTGKDFMPDQLEVVPHINPTTGKINKFTHEFRIFFKKPSDHTMNRLILPPDVDLKDVGNKNHSINNNNYVLNLLERGFLAGNNSANIERIRDRIPVEFLRHFDEGVAAV